MIAVKTSTESDVKMLKHLVDFLTPEVSTVPRTRYTGVYAPLRKAGRSQLG